MKIYFSAAIIFNEKRGKIYSQIVKTLSDSGHKVLTYGVTDSNIDDIMDQSEDKRVEHYHQVTRWIAEADLVVVEASFPSTLHIGHEIGLALEKGKPVIVMYEKGFSPFFLTGNSSDKLFLVEYTNATVSMVLKDAIEYASEQSDTRFNFFVSPSIVNYLDWVSKKRRLPRAVYLRKLIEEEMKNNTDYNESK